MTTIRDLKPPFETLSDQSRFILVKDIRYLRRLMPEKKKRTTVRTASAKPKQSKQKKFDIGSITPEQAKLLLARLKERQNGS